MRLRHRTVRAPRQGGSRPGGFGRQGAPGARGRQHKAAGRQPVRAARPPPGFAAAADGTESEEELLLSESEEEPGEDDADLLLQAADSDSEGQQQQQEQQPAACTPAPPPPTSTHRQAPSSDARWLAAMALSPLLSLPQLQPDTQAASVWAAPSGTPMPLAAVSPALEAGLVSPAALPSPAFHDFGGPSLPPRHPLWGSQPAAPTVTAAAAVGPAAGAAPQGAERAPALVGGDGSGRAGLAAASAAVAREASLLAAGGRATSPPMHPWDLHRPAKGPSPVQLHDVRQLQQQAAATPAKVPVPASAANPQPYHLFASGSAVPFVIPHAQFGLPRKPRPEAAALAASAAQPPQRSHLAAPASEADAAAAVQAAFAAAAAEPSPRSGVTATHYSAGSSLAARHTHAPLSGGLAGGQPQERPQRSRRQRELSEEFHWTDEEEEEGGGGGSDTETDEDEDM